MSKSDDNYSGILLEQILDEIKAVHEVVAGQPTREEFNDIKDDVKELKRDMKVVKAAFTDQGRQVNDHERRIGKLETA